MPLQKVCDGFWKYGSTKIVTKEGIEKLKSWGPEDAVAIGINESTFRYWRKKNFQNKSFVVIDNPSLVENISEIELERHGSRYIINETEWNKIKACFGANLVFRKIIYDNSKLTNVEGEPKIPLRTVQNWMEKVSSPLIVPDTDYESIYNRLTTAEDQETLMMSAGLGLLEGYGGFEKEILGPRWRYGNNGKYNHLIALAGSTGLLPRPKNAKDVNRIHLDPNYADFLEKNGFIEWRDDFGSFTLPDDFSPSSLCGKNKNAFLAQAIQPSLTISYGYCNTLGFQLRSHGGSDKHHEIVIDLLKEFNALPSKARASKDLGVISEDLKENKVIIFEEDEQHGIFLMYAPQGLLDTWGFEYDLNAIRLKNLVEEVIPYTFHFEDKYQDILKFESRVNKYAEFKAAREEYIEFRKSLERIEGICLPHLEKKEFEYAGKKYEFRMPVWYSS